jgi:hypothetical protein
MIKRCLNIILLIGLQLICFSHSKNLVDSTNNMQIDSLKQRLLIEKNDSLRIRIIQGIGLNEKKKIANENYKPTVSIKTKKLNNKIEIIVKTMATVFRKTLLIKSFSHSLLQNQQEKEQVWV